MEVLKIDETLDNCECVHDTKSIENIGLPSEEEITSLADFFKVFGDKTRIRILYLLKEQELCVCDLADVLGMTSPAVSHQLRILKINRLIKSRRDGKSVFYSLDDHHIHDILAQGMVHVGERFPLKNEHTHP